jgi:uncharacterized membrane protein YebE (DUF533 family)
MTREPNILDQLLAGGGSDLLAKAKANWDAQPAGTKGAVAGGLLAALLGGRGGLGTVAKVGAAAMVGSVASRAYADYKAGKPPLDAVADALGLPEGTFGGTEPADDLADRLVRAMIAAANADGKITITERKKIAEQMALLGFPEDAAALIDIELAGPPDVARIAALATTEEEATQIYTASLLVVNTRGEAEKAWLDALANALTLEPALVAHLHAHAKNLMLRA